MIAAPVRPPDAPAGASPAEPTRVGRGRFSLAAAVTAIALLAAVAVQRDVLLPLQLDRVTLQWAGAAFLGLLAWLAAGWLARLDPASESVLTQERPSTLNPQPSTRLLPLALLLGSGALLVAGLVLIYRDHASSSGAWLWLVGLLGAIGAIAVRDWPRRTLRPPSTRADWIWRGLAAVVVVGALLLRVYALDTIPADFNNDEGELGDAALNIIHQTPGTGQHISLPISIFETLIWGSTPYGFIYVHGAVMQLAGETMWGVRLPTAISGAVGVWLLYLLLRDYVRPWAAVGAAALMAISQLHLFWSRVALPQAMTASFATGIVWMMLRGLRSRAYLPWVLAGVLLGGSQHLYQGARLLVVVVGLFVVYLALTRRGFIAERWTHVAAMAAASILVFMPLGFWYWRFPHELTSRAGGVMVILDERYMAGHFPGMSPLEVALEQLRRGLVGLAVSGDGSGAFHRVSRPLFDPIIGALIVLGAVGFTLTAGRRPERMLVAIWFWFSAIFYCAFTIDPPPMTRLFSVVPAVFFIAGVTLDRVGRTLEGAGGRAALAVAALPALLAFGMAFSWNYRAFFVEVPGAHPAGIWTQLATVIRQAGPEFKTYMLSPPHLFYYNSALRFLIRGHFGDDLMVQQLPVRERAGRDGLFVVHVAVPEALGRLRAIYPNGELAEHRTPGGELWYTTYRVTSDELNAAAPADAPLRQYEQRFGTRGEDFGQYRNPNSLAADGAGRVYVADSGNVRVSLWAGESGRPLDSFGTATGDAALSRVWSVAAALHGEILVVDRQTRWVHRFSDDGSWVGRFGGPGTLAEPWGAAFAPDGGFVVADSGLHTILRFDSDGALLGQLGTRGEGRGQFQGPTSLAFGSDGSLYVVDSGNARVQRFSPDGTVVSMWPIPRAEIHLGPQIAVSPLDGAVYVTDPLGGQVHRYTPDGAREWSIGAHGDSPLHFMVALGVAADGLDNLYVLDSHKHLIHRFDLSRIRR